MVILILMHFLENYWHQKMKIEDIELEELSFVAKPEDIKALKNYIADEYADDKLKMDIMNWMWDKRKQINSSKPKDKIPNYNREVYTFLKLIGAKQLLYKGSHTWIYTIKKMILPLKTPKRMKMWNMAEDSIQIA